MSGYKYLLVLLFLIGCVPHEPISEVLPVAEKALVQCWDNSTVESLDACPPVVMPVVNETKVVAKASEKTILRELLQKAPLTYWFHDGNFRVFVSGTKRSEGMYDQYWNTYYRIMFWDVSTREVFILAPQHVKEFWWMQKKGINQTGGDRSMALLPAFFQLNLTGNKEADKLLIPKEFNKYWFDMEEDELDIILRPVYTKSPFDIVQEYAYDEPVRIDTVTKLLSNAGGNFESNLSITYKNKGKIAPLIVFRFDKKGVPLIIDEMDGAGKLVKRINYEFGIDYKDDYQLIRVTSEHVSLPENSIIVSVKDYEEYWDYIG